MAAENLEGMCKHPVVEKIIEMRGAMCDYTVYHCLPLFGGCNKIYRDVMDDWYMKVEDVKDESEGIAAFLREAIILRDGQNKERKLYLLKDLNPIEYLDKDRILKLVK